jgi:hypothetical protein
MNSYQPPAHRMAFGFAAVAMTALTIAVMVVLPARMESGSEANAMLAASQDAGGPCITALPESRSWKWAQQRHSRSRPECAAPRGWSSR